MSSFEAQIDDPDCGYAIEDLGTRVAMVAFGGIQGGLQMPPFEFFNLARDLPVTKIFVRDKAQCWYGRGVEGLGTDLEGTAEGLGRLATERDFTPVFFGVSAGGFAALAASALIPSGGAYVFSPQVSLRRFERARLLDNRWKAQIARLRSTQSPIDDVRPLVAASTYDVPRNIYASSAHRLDAGHARLVRNLRGVQVKMLPAGGHAVVKNLRDSGALHAIIHEALAFTSIG